MKISAPEVRCGRPNGKAAASRRTPKRWLPGGAFGVRQLAGAFSTATQRGFTMVEIAICLAVIGFALVAIIGVLPTGMQVQRDNREETIINQDGSYFMEAIRSGAQGLYELTNYVTEVSVTEAVWDQPNNTWAAVVYQSPQKPPVCPAKMLSGTHMIGALSTPQGWACIPDCLPPDSNRRVYRTQAKVRSISGAAIEKGEMETLTFEYLLISEILPFVTVDPNLSANPNKMNLTNNLFEIRLTFRWPILATGRPGNGRKVFRSLVSGNLTTNAYGYFFEPSTYRKVGLP